MEGASGLTEDGRIVMHGQCGDQCFGFGGILQQQVHARIGEIRYRGHRCLPVAHSTDGTHGGHGLEIKSARQAASCVEGGRDLQLADSVAARRFCIPQAARMRNHVTERESAIEAHSDAQMQPGCEQSNDKPSVSYAAEYARVLLNNVLSVRGQHVRTFACISKLVIRVKCAACGT